jgi:LysR family hydrogen peroxide-inducible transcriptional activator
MEVVLDLKQIRYFLTLSEVLNFTRAAEIINVTQPTLTKAIQKLEEVLGGTLIFRDGKDTRLTELGKQLTTEFNKISDLEQSARELARLANTQENSVLNIGISRTIGPPAFSMFLAKTAEMLAGVRIIVHDVEGDMVNESILAGELDCCFCADQSVKNTKLDISCLFEERLMLAFNEKHPFSLRDSISPNELENEIYIDRLHCEFRSKVIESLKESGLSLNARLQFGREDWVQSSLSSGVGVSAMPERSVMLPGIAIAPMDGVDLKRDICFVTIYGPYTSSVVKTFRTMVNQHNWNQWPDKK